MRGEDIIRRTGVMVQAAGVDLDGELVIPQGAEAVVIFAHGSGSSRHSPRNRSVADALHSAGLATLLFDLLTPEEEAIDLHTRALRFDIALLADRLTGAVDWADTQRATRRPRAGLFGASTGAAAALIAAAQRPESVGAVVSRGGRPDLAGDTLAAVQAPTLLIVGSDDTLVIELNRQASGLMRTERHLEIIPGASHLFEEPGALDQVAQRACDWFSRYLLPVRR